MASGLESYVNLIYVGGYVLLSYAQYPIQYFRIQGTLKGFDQTINLILDDSHERVYSTTQGVEQVVLGLHIIRGDNVAIVGEMDEAIDTRLDLSSLRAEPLGSVVH